MLSRKQSRTIVFYTRETKTSSDHVSSIFGVRHSGALKPQFLQIVLQLVAHYCFCLSGKFSARCFSAHMRHWCSLRSFSSLVRLSPMISSCRVGGAPTGRPRHTSKRERGVWQHEAGAAGQRVDTSARWLRTLSFSKYLIFCRVLECDRRLVFTLRNFSTSLYTRETAPRDERGARRVLQSKIL